MSISHSKIFPRSRIATIDICNIGLKKHHIAAILEVDVTEAREKIKLYKKNTGFISFSAWLIKAICFTVNEHKGSAAFLKGKRKYVYFDDVNVSFLVEKEINGEKAPFPLLIKDVNNMDIQAVTNKIDDSVNQKISDDDIVLQNKSSSLEKLYYF